MPSSLIDFRDWSQSDLKNIFDVSFALEKAFQKPSSLKDKTAALIFFEASTRTRVSFEQACYREGIMPSLMIGKSSSSLEKGETYLDTILNIAAMGPDVLVIRCGYELNLHTVAKKISQPILNGGWGVTGHPTQALLDIRTLLKQGMNFSDIKLLIVGDVRHSRVASSHFELAQKMGYDVAVCCPESLSPQKDVKRFNDLQDGLEWANSVMVLRFQFERHTQKAEASENLLDFRLGLSELKKWKNQGWLMHPGPVNYGVELKLDVEQYQNNLILKQVESGVWIRRACLHQVMGSK
jgi:aspartate carbamoyltransferase catalytic subunit